MYCGLILDFLKFAAVNQEFTLAGVIVHRVENKISLTLAGEAFTCTTYMWKQAGEL